MYFISIKIKFLGLYRSLYYMFGCMVSITDSYFILAVVVTFKKNTHMLFIYNYIKLSNMLCNKLCSIELVCNACNANKVVAFSYIIQLLLAVHACDKVLTPLLMLIYQWTGDHTYISG